MRSFVFWNECVGFVEIVDQFIDRLKKKDESRDESNRAKNGETLSFGWIKYTASSIVRGSRFFMISSTTKRIEFSTLFPSPRISSDVLVMPSDMISCILHDAEMIRVARRSMTRTFQSCRSFCRTDSQRNISLINSNRKLTRWPKLRRENDERLTCSDELLQVGCRHVRMFAGFFCLVEWRRKWWNEHRQAERRRKAEREKREEEKRKKKRKEKEKTEKKEKKKWNESIWNGNAKEKKNTSDQRSLKRHFDMNWRSICSFAKEKNCQTARQTFRCAYAASKSGSFSLSGSTNEKNEDWKRSSGKVLQLSDALRRTARSSLVDVDRRIKTARFSSFCLSLRLSAGVLFWLRERWMSSFVSFSGRVSKWSPICCFCQWLTSVSSFS